MKKSTEKFCKVWEDSQDTRAAIKSAVVESRFSAYAELLSKNSDIVKLAKKGSEQEVALFIRNNLSSLKLPVTLTDRGVRRVASELVLKFRG